MVKLRGLHLSSEGKEWHAQVPITPVSVPHIYLYARSVSAGSDLSRSNARNSATCDNSDESLQNIFLVAQFLALVRS